MNRKLDSLAMYAVQSVLPVECTDSLMKEGVQEPTNEKQDSHLLLLIDPDAPSREDPKWGPFLHWIQPGLKPLSIDEIASVADTGEGARDDAVWVKKDQDAKVEYLGPAPPEGTGYALISPL